jgi:recombinational DNA repair ATPase RecF
LNFSFEEGDKNRKHTLILGQNGAGKSNLLKAISLVTAGSNALGEILGNPESWIRYGKDTCHIIAVITTAENETRKLELSIKKGDH